MDCLRFRARHLDYLDDALSSAGRAACDRHRDRCAACAAFDARVRRSLLLARNLASVPSGCDVTARVLAALSAVRPLAVIPRGAPPVAPPVASPAPIRLAVR